MWLLKASLTVYTNTNPARDSINTTASPWRVTKFQLHSELIRLLKRSATEKKNARTLHSHFLGFHFDLCNAEESRIPNLQKPRPIQIAVRFNFGNTEANIFASFCGFRFVGEFRKPEAHRRCWTEFHIDFPIFLLSEDCVGNFDRNMAMHRWFFHV